MSLPLIALPPRRTFLDKSGALAAATNTVLAAPADTSHVYRLFAVSIYYANATPQVFSVRYGVSVVDHYVGYAGLGVEYEALIPPEGMLVSSDGTGGQALKIVSPVIASYALVYQLLEL